MRSRPLLTTLACVLAVLSLPALSDELMKWERIPLSIPLKTGTERVIFVDKNVRVGFPPALSNKLRVQSAGGAVYLKASEDFPLTRLHLQDVESGEMILLDIQAGAEGSDEPVKLIYQGEVSTQNRRQDNTDNKGSSQADTAKSKQGITSNHATVSHNPTPAPVLLTRYAAQSLYAPLRTIETLPGIHPVNARLPENITTLLPSEPVLVTPLAAWGLGSQAVVALKIQNQSYHRVVLDARALQGRFITATFQHRYLGAKGRPEDTTTLYLVTDTRPERAFIPEGVLKARPKGNRKTKVVSREAAHAH